MKIKHIYMVAALALAGMAITACSDEKLSSESVFNVQEETPNEFDLWIKKNFTDPYNIRFNYRYIDNESDRKYNVSPADYEKSIALAKLVRHMWIDVYTEAVNADFLKTYAPRVFQLTGSYKWSANGEQVLGTAEGGMKIMLYGVNELDIDNPRINVDDHFESRDKKPIDMNYWFFHTMHHEFCHILTQTKNYDLDFQTISAGTYHSADWVNVKDKKAVTEGFVTGYASGEYNEDFAETYATYITLTDEAWGKVLEAAGDKGAPIILAKLEMIRTYFKDSWNIDIDELRQIVLYQSSTVKDLDLRTLD
ncbi:MAG: putative zinc-binding metallopeptidase [Prevotella sp.]|nr:putative zinc-binding metallopeptidase [Prevotella sp.]MBP3745662.1 putative zinc-binding metallopeptidase [Prevotella sp.]